MNPYWLGAILAISGLLAFGCDDDSSPGGTGGTGGGTGTGGTGGTSSEMVTVNVSFEGLEDLGDDFVYEGWVIVDGSPVSTGIFEIDEEGNPEPSSFEVPKEDIDEAERFVLTIEPAEDDDPAPSATKVLGGDVEDGEAELTIGDEMALGDSLEDAGGNFFLATPTSSADDDDQNGIWMFTPGEPATPLDLPELPAGWTYEGWVVDITGDTPEPISTGTFDDPSEPDSNGAGPGVGDTPENAPGYPGEDFIEGEGNPRDLTPDEEDAVTHRVVISVEPVPDNSPAPFRIKPLMSDISDDLAPTLQEFGNVIEDNTITGMVTIEE